jgi:hypothetical protein
MKPKFESRSINTFVVFVAANWFYSHEKDVTLFEYMLPILIMCIHNQSNVMRKGRKHTWAN